LQTEGSADVHIDLNRLIGRLDELARIGAIEGGGSCRLALTDADRRGRDRFVGWLRELGMAVRVDRIGNVTGTWPPGDERPPVMMGSHLDTVATGGRFDGALGVLAGLEVVQTLQDAGHRPGRPLAVGAFTNEEGARFQPDMLGSLVWVGGLSLPDALAQVGTDGCTVGEALAGIGYAGEAQVPGPTPHAFVELHVEQGPILEEQGVDIGAVAGVQGIAWTELHLVGESNHAGTCPMRLRHDPGYGAAAIATFVRDMCLRLGGGQVGTVGRIELHPNLINVVPAEATMTVDLRNTDAVMLAQSRRELGDFVAALAEREGLEIASRTVADFDPVEFDPELVARIERIAEDRGQGVRRMASGAGHDAQMFARVCPSAMIFVPSRGGISHNPAEFTEPHQLQAGADVLLQLVLEFAG